MSGIPLSTVPLLQVRIICSASVPISSLFVYQHQDSESDQSRVLMDDLGLSQVGDATSTSFPYKMAQWLRV